MAGNQPEPQCGANSGVRRRGWLAARTRGSLRSLACFALVLTACGGGGGGGSGTAVPATAVASGGDGGAIIVPRPAPTLPGPVTTPPGGPGTCPNPSAPGNAGSGANVIQLENAKPGDSDWTLTALSDTPTVEGYASATSVNRGETIRFYVSSAAPTYEMTIYRIGWYGGAGARRMHSVTLPGTRQPVPRPDAAGLVDANWNESYRLTIPQTADRTDWASGLYLAKLTPSTGTQSYIPFWVRDDASTSTFVFQSAVTTAQAYNNWGGKSLYGYNSTGGAARKVSFNRPYQRQGFVDTGVGKVFVFEINFLRFLEREGYDVSYITNIDVHADAGRLLRHRAFLVAGHDEYWTYEMRAGVQAARARGVHLGFFSANQTYWQVRLEPDARSGEPHRTLVGYKGFAAAEDPLALDGDPSNDRYITTRYRDIQRLFGVNDPVAQPENSLVGVMYHGDPVDGDVVVSDAGHWVFAGTGAANGTRLRGLLGYETDAVANNGYTPAGLEIVGASPDPFGVSHMATYTHPSGAIVFATGTMQWNWGLDDFGGRGLVSGVAQQATRNVLSRFATSGPAAPPGGGAGAGTVC